MNSSPLADSPVEDVAPDVTESYGHHVNPAWARLVNILGMNLRYTRCSGVELETTDGRTILDYLSGYCVHNAGHNHPYIVRELVRELQSSGPSMLQSNIVESAAELAEALCKRAGGKGHQGFLWQLRERGDRSCHQILPRLYWTHRDCLRDRSLSRLDLRRTLVDGR